MRAGQTDPTWPSPRGSDQGTYSRVNKQQPDIESKELLLLRQTVRLHCSSSEKYYVEKEV